MRYLRQTTLPTLLALATALAVTTGCGPGAGLPKEISAQEVESNVTAIFQSAPAETRKLAEEVADAIQKQDFTTAWDKLQALGEKTGLTDAQKAFVASSTASVGAEVNKAGAAGDEKAQEAIEFHRANK